MPNYSPSPVYLIFWPRTMSAGHVEAGKGQTIDHSMPRDVRNKKLKLKKLKLTASINRIFSLSEY